jgi:hypothetical protein
MDEASWEKASRNSFCRRKIMIHIGHASLSLLFTREEVQELRQLLLHEKSTAGPSEVPVCSEMIPSYSLN